MATTNNSEGRLERGRYTDPWLSGPFSMSSLYFSDVRGIASNDRQTSFAVDNSTVAINYVDQGALLIC